MNTIIFYGNSNTYGYDPRSFFGERYPKEIIWTYRTAEALGESYKVINEGMNGRCLPSGPESTGYIMRLVSGLDENDLFAVMLGTNDLLRTASPDASVPVERMEVLLRSLSGRKEFPKILIIAPPLAGYEIKGDPYLDSCRKENIRMNRGFRLLAEKYHVCFADAAEWNIELAFDGVHFSEEGHRVFAEHMTAFLRSELHL